MGASIGAVFGVWSALRVAWEELQLILGFFTTVAPRLELEGCKNVDRLLGGYV